MRFLPLLALLAFLIAAPTVQAAEIVQCGVPSDTDMDTDPVKEYCDIYARQNAYLEKDRAYREKIEERRVNYVAPQLQAREGARDTAAPTDITAGASQNLEATDPQNQPEMETQTDSGEPINLIDGIQ